jgi:hypothetical protein
VIPKPLATRYTTSATKPGPLSDLIDTGILNRGMISVSRHLATSWAFSIHVEKISTHPEKVQMNTNRYLYPRARGISGKSTIKLSKEFHQCSAPGEAPLALAGVCFWHIGYIFPILPYLCWRVRGHKSAGPGWSQGLFVLNEVLCGTA